MRRSLLSLVNALAFFLQPLPSLWFLPSFIHIAIQCGPGSVTEHAAGQQTSQCISTLPHSGHAGCDVVSTLTLPQKFRPPKPVVKAPATQVKGLTKSRTATQAAATSTATAAITKARSIQALQGLVSTAIGSIVYLR